MLPQSAADYLELGFDPIPLERDTKRPIVRGWRELPPPEQWRDVPADSNIGLRCGRGFAVVDADDKKVPGTLSHVRDWLFGLGYEPGSYPVIATASGLGGHVYLSLAGSLPGHARNLARDVGAGELRFGAGAQVVAPPSTVEGRPYRLLEGDLRALPVVTVEDVRPLLGTVEEPAPRVEMTPTEGGRRVPALAWALLTGVGETAHTLTGVKEGMCNLAHPLTRYRTRSEADQAIVTSLVNAGFDFGEVLAIFDRHQESGHYRDLAERKRSEAIGYLRRCYEKAVRFTATDTEGRELGRRAAAWAQRRPWPGRTGATDRLVYVAHADIATQCGKVEYRASVREVAERAGVSFRTATASHHRLVTAGLLSLVRPGLPSFAALYRLPDVWGVGETTHTLLNPCEGMCKSAHPLPDAFRRGGLGQVGAQLWAALADGSKTRRELVALTGRNDRTVRRMLAKMARLVDVVTGETVAMVERRGEGWHRLEAVDLARVAEIVGTAGRGRAQRALHKQQQARQRDAARREVRRLERAADVPPQAGPVATPNRLTAGAGLLTVSKTGHPKRAAFEKGEFNEEIKTADRPDADPASGARSKV